MTTKIDPLTAKREFEELLQIEKRLTAISVEAKRLADASGLSRRALAMRMGNLSPSHLQRLLRGMAYKASIDTLAKFAWACGHELSISFVPRTEKGATAELRPFAASETTTKKGLVNNLNCCPNNVIDFATRRAEYAKVKNRWTQTCESLPEQVAYGEI